jgi:hypothetical protein
MTKQNPPDHSPKCSPLLHISGTSLKDHIHIVYFFTEAKQTSSETPHHSDALHRRQWFQVSSMVHFQIPGRTNRQLSFDTTQTT